MVANKARSGRKRIIQDREHAVVQQVLDQQRQAAVRELVDCIAARFTALGLPHPPAKTAILAWLKRNGYRKCKLTTKPGLNQAQKVARLEFALQRLEWSLEDWKRIVWSDETSCTLGGYRGKRGVWRKPSERNKHFAVRSRWKGFSQFMFWGCFSYYHKGPSHCWKQENPEMKHYYANLMDKYNEEHEPAQRALWEAQRELCNIHIDADDRAKPRGRQPTWKWNAASGKQVRTSKGGIDWMRYQQEVLLPKFLPFLRQHQSDPSGALIAQEDNAPAHASRWNREIWKQAGIEILEWPANSPDLSAIEPPWFILKVQTTARGPITSDVVLRRTWTSHWSKLPQSTLQCFVKRIPGNIEWVARLWGGNDYTEGSKPPAAKLTPAEIHQRWDYIHEFKEKQRRERELKEQARREARKTRSKTSRIVVNAADLAQEDPLQAAQWEDL